MQSKQSKPTITMRHYNVESRVRRIQKLFQVNLWDEFDSQLERKRKSSVDKHSGIKLEEQVVSELENKYGIYKSVVRVDELKKSINNRYNILLLDKEQLKEWFYLKCEECADFCNSDVETASTLLYNAFMHTANHPDLTGNLNHDIDIFMNDIQLKGMFIGTMISSTIGCN